MEDKQNRAKEYNTKRQEKQTMDYKTKPRNRTK